MAENTDFTTLKRDEKMSNEKVEIKMNYEKWEFFMNVIESLKECFDETELIFNEKGIIINEMSPDHAMLVTGVIKPTFFESWSIKEKHRSRVELHQFSRFLKRGMSGDAAQINFEFEKAEIIFTQKKLTRKFSLPYNSVKLEPAPEPNISFINKLKVKSDIFQQSIHDLNILSDLCLIEASSDKLTFKAEGDAGSIEIESTELLQYESQIPDPQSALYSLSFLVDIMKVAPLFEEVTLQLSNACPIRIQFKNSEVELSYILAPRVDEFTHLSQILTMDKNLIFVKRNCGSITCYQVRGDQLFPVEDAAYFKWKDESLPDWIEKAIDELNSIEEIEEDEKDQFSFNEYAKPE